MNERWPKLGPILAALLIGGLLYALLRPREPVYEGRRLSEWLQDFSLYQASDTEEPEQAAKAATEAIRHLGTNCLPQLLDMLQTHDSELKMEMIRWLHKHVAIEVPFWPAHDLKYQADRAFAALGPAAQSAMPPLAALLTNSFASSAAASALASIGPQALPILAAATTNPNPQFRSSVISALGNPQLRAQQVLPLLAAGLQDSSIDIRQMAVRQLGSRLNDSADVLPLLLEAMRDADPLVRRIGIDALRNAKEHTREIAPALLRALSDSSPLIRQRAVHQLENLAPAESELVVPALAQLLNDADPARCATACALLCGYGGQARSTVPSLVRLFHNGDADTKEAAGRALCAIDPQTAVSLGLNPVQYIFPRWTVPMRQPASQPRR